MGNPSAFHWGTGKKAFTLALAFLWPFLAPKAQVLDLDLSRNKAVILSGERVYSLFLDPKNAKILPLENHFVIFDRSTQELVWVSFEDLLARRHYHRTRGVLALETAQISLAGEFPSGGGVWDVGVWDSRSVSTFILAQKGPPGKMRIKSLRFAKSSPPPRGEGASREKNPLPPPMVRALVGKEQSIWGSGPIAVLRDPRSGTPVLLSWDETHHLLHEYDLSPEGRMDFKGSLPLEGLPEGAKVEVLNASLSRNHHFELMVGGEKRSFSLTRLSMARSMKRAEVVSAVVNERANSWTKSLLFLGLMNQAVDSLDRAFGNRWISAEQIANDPEMNPLSKRVDVKELLGELRREKILPEQAVEELERKHFLNSTSGKKWFASAAALMGIYGVNKARKASPALGAAFDALNIRIRSTLVASLQRLGLSQDRITKISQRVDRKQRHLRGWMLRHHYNDQLPKRDIKKVEKSLMKICKKLKTPGANEILGKIIVNRKLKSFGQRSKTIIDLAHSPAMDNLIDEFTQRFVQNSSIRKLRAKLRQGLASMEEGPHWTKTAGIYFGRRLEKILAKTNSLTPVHRLQITMERLNILEQHVEVSKRVTRLKGEVIFIDKMSAKRAGRGMMKSRSSSPTARSEKDIEYLGISGKEAILNRAVKAQKKAKALGLSQKYTTLSQRMTSALEKLEGLEAQVAMLSTKGKVHPFFDFWAKSIVLPYARYILPEKKFYHSKNPKVRKLADWLKHHARRDYVKSLQPGKYENITVTGENARLGFGMWVSDTVLDVFSQSLARINSVDSKERLWGDSPYHLDFMPGEKVYGPHFDLIGNALTGIPWWLLSMPINFSRFNYSYGKSSRMSYFHRMKDELKRGFNPVNIIYGYPKLWFAWWLTGQSTMYDYRKRAGDDVDPTILAQIQKDLDDRLWSPRSTIEKRFYMNIVDNLIVMPQFYMREELGKFLKLTGGTKTAFFLNNFIVPFTTSFYFHKWWADYFGTTNPNMIKILRRFNADGILNKIDEDGMTDLKSWSVHEAVTFSTLITLFEMRKLEKEIPFPQDDVVAMANWYGMLYARLLRGRPLPEESQSKDFSALLSERVKIRDHSGMGLPFEYEDEARDFLAMIDQIQSMTRQYSIEKSKRKVYLLATDQSAKKILQHNLKAALDDVAKVQGKLAQTLRVLKENGEEFKDLQRTDVNVAIVDTVILTDVLFSGVISNLAGKTLGGIGQVKALKPSLGRVQVRLGQHLKKWGRKAALPALLASIPLYFWLGDQIEGHGEIQKIHGDLLEELQDILFQLTRSLISAQLALTYDGKEIDEKSREIFEGYRKQLIDKEQTLREVLRVTKDRNEVLQKERLYRIPQILSDYAPIGAGIGLSWMGGHWLLSKVSKRLIHPMSDRFAPGLVKFSALVWLGSSQIYNGIEKEILLTSYDFFKFHTVYRQTLFEKYLIECILEGKQDSIDWQRDVVEKSLEDKFLDETTFYKNRLLEILKNK